MACKNKLVLLSRREFQSDRPTLVLLHGATTDPSEMLLIAREYIDTRNVFLYSYNFHHSIEQLAQDFVSEIKALQTAHPELAITNASKPVLTVITYSYSTAIFRGAVLASRESGMFSATSLVELAPTAGGSIMARYLRNPVNALLVAMASQFSRTQNPYGRLAKELWSDEGNRKFHEVIPPEKVYTFLVEDDRHSLAEANDEEVRKRYHNGIGTNVVTIPKSSGVTHENFPVHPEGINYLRSVLEPSTKKSADAGK